jgi:hypothetical protein
MLFCFQIDGITLFNSATIRLHSHFSADEVMEMAE